MTTNFSFAHALARLCAATYTEPATWERDDVHACLSPLGGFQVVAFRGTTEDPRTWARDLSVCPTRVPGLGFVHRGFYQGAASVVDQIIADLPPGPLIITGHSLGGALAVDLAAQMIRRHIIPLQLVTFAAPRTGFAKLGRVLRDQPMRITQYRCGNDPVPLVPWLCGLYRDIVPLTHVGVASLDPFDCHHIDRYVEAV